MIICVAVHEICAANKREGTNCKLSEMARGDWVIGPRAHQCEYLAAIDRGQVLDVWRIDRTKGVAGWMLPSQSPRKGLPSRFQAERPACGDARLDSRRCCELIEIEDKDEKRRLLRHIGSPRLCGSIGYVI